MLAWFASLDGVKLEEAWRHARDTLEPKSIRDNFICRACRHWVPGIACAVGKDFKACEREVIADPTAWSSREENSVIAEGRAAFRLLKDECGCRRCQASINDARDAQCKYEKGSVKEAQWKTGWDEAVAFEKAVDTF